MEALLYLSAGWNVVSMILLGILYAWECYREKGESER